MSDSFYVFLNEDTSGPYSRRQLREMWKCGAVTSETYILPDGSDHWVQLISIEDTLTDSSFLNPSLPPPNYSEPTPEPQPVRKNSSSTAQSGCGGCLAPLAAIILFSIAVNSILSFLGFNTGDSASPPRSKAWEKELREGAAVLGYDNLTPKDDEILRRAAKEAQRTYGDPPNTAEQGAAANP